MAGPFAVRRLLTAAALAATAIVGASASPATALSCAVRTVEGMIRHDTVNDPGLSIFTGRITALRDDGLHIAVRLWFYGEEAGPTVVIASASEWTYPRDPEQHRELEIGEDYFFSTYNRTSSACSLTTPLGTAASRDLLEDARRVTGEPQRFGLPETDARVVPSTELPWVLLIVMLAGAIAGGVAVDRRRHRNGRAAPIH